jgi:arylsulfatase
MLPQSLLSRRQFSASLAAAVAPPARRRPNIILMMADDMGYSDIGCYGGEIATPHLDSMARQGVRFTQFYNTARCCPTRASLLTGLHPHQAGVGHMVDTGRQLPGYRGDLNGQCVTIAEALRPAGYRTAMSGKWHVTPVTESKHNWPLQRGFEKYYGIIHGAASFFDPVTLVRDNEFAPNKEKDYYFTDAIGDNAVRYIDEFSRGAAPFFLYVAFTSPHWPLHALESDIAKYRGRYKDGWDALRLERHARMKTMGIVDPRWPLTPRDEKVPAWSDAPGKEWFQRRMEVYAAQVDRMDQNIGRVFSKLKETGADQDTLVLFLSDNGGCAEELGPKSAARHIPKVTLDGRPVLPGNRPELMPGGPDTYQSYGLPWANASNTPFRRYKHWVHEGGISSPLIARWPRALQKTGTLTPQPGQLVDIMATCLDAAGAQYPSSRQGEPVKPLEGRSLLPAARLGKPVPRELFWEHEGNRAVRSGDWKLVSRHPGDWELFDLQADRSELNNLAAAQPAKVAELKAKWEAWAKRANVEAWDTVQKAPRV